MPETTWSSQMVESIYGCPVEFRYWSVPSLTLAQDRHEESSQCQVQEVESKQVAGSSYLISGR